jgi:hypothetical protein
MSSTHVFGIHAFGCNFHVESTSSEVQTILDHYIFPSLPRQLGSEEPPDILVRVARIAEKLQASVNGVPVVTARRSIDLVPALVRVLDDAVIQRMVGLRAVHAGAVLLGGRALLLPGATHAGKSSLVAELLRNGATYFSDEYALLDSEGCVHPYPRPLLLRNGCPDVLPVLADECNASTGDGPAPIGWILFLEYQPDSTWSVAAVPQGEAVLALLRNTPHAWADSPDLVGVFRRAVAGAGCYAGRRGDAVDAAAQILQLVGGPV